MKKTIATMLILAMGCMSLASCSTSEGRETAADTEVTGAEVTEDAGTEDTAETTATEDSAPEETEATNETNETTDATDAANPSESEAAPEVEVPAGGYIRYSYKIDDATGERVLTKIEEYDADDNLLSDMNYGSVGEYGVTFVYVDGNVTEEWYTNTDGETYLSSRLEYATVAGNECKSIVYNYDHEELTYYSVYEYDEQSGQCVRSVDYDAEDNLTGYREFEYDEDGSYTVTGYTADGTPTGNVTVRNAAGNMITDIRGYGSDEHLYRTEYIRNDNGDVLRTERYEDDVLQGYTEYEYDDAGRRASVTSYGADGNVYYTHVCEYEYPDA